MALPHLPSDTRFLVNSNAKAWQLDSLVAFGIGPDRLEIQPDNIHTRVERLWFATPLGHSSLGSGAVVRKVANRLRHQFKAADSIQKAHRRIYISRAKAAFRRIVNEDDITPSLQEHGFETVLCEDLSLQEQVRLFAEATAIVGGHGAGLTNVIYCERGSFVGEIRIDGVPPAYVVMAQQLGMRFSRFNATPLAIQGSQVDMQVDAAAFKKWIGDCLDSLKQPARNPI